MAFTRKVPYGLTTLKTWVSESVAATNRSIQNWCRNTFSLNTHTHTYTFPYVVESGTANSGNIKNIQTVQ